MLYAHFNESHIQDSVFVMDGFKTFISSSPLVVAPDNLNPLSEIPCNGIDAIWAVPAEYREYLRRTRTWTQDLWPAGHPIIHDLLPSTVNATGWQFESKCKATKPHNILFNPTYINCLKEAKLCMWGDSQMRHLHNTIVAASFHSAQDLTGIGKKEILDGPSRINCFSKVWDNFDQDIDNCTTIIASFGQWPASWNKEYPWQFDKYKVYAEADMVYLKLLEKKYSGMRTFWMTTNPHGYAGYGIPMGCEWRTDPVLDRCHEINLKLAFTHGLRILDTYRIAKPLNDPNVRRVPLSGYCGLDVGNICLGRNLRRVRLN